MTKRFRLRNVSVATAVVCIQVGIVVRAVRPESSTGALASTPHHGQEHEVKAVAESDLEVFHKFIESADVDQSVSKSNCRRIDGKAVTIAALKHLHEPTILTGLLNGDAHDKWSSWTKERILQDHGHVLFSEKVLHHNGAGFYMLEHLGMQTGSLANIIKLDQPGNLFVEKAEPESFATDLLDVNALRSTKLGAGDKVFLSFGSKGQWNQVHKHEAALFMQVKGSKGWSMAPAEVFPNAKEHWRNHEWHHIKELQQAYVCGPFAHHAIEDHSGTRDASVTAAHKNFTERGRFCTIREGEAILVPNHWWHGTCDLGEWNAGFTRFYK